MNDMAIEVIVVVVAIVGLVLAGRAPVESVGGWAAGFALGLATIVPATQAPDRIVAESCISIATICLVVVIRRRGRMDSWYVLVPITLLVVWVALRTFEDASRASSALSLLIGADVLGAASVARGFTRADFRSFTRVLAVVVLIHCAIAVGEQVGAVGTIWGTAGAQYQSVQERENILVASLSGRSQSSFAHPIPMASFMAVALLFFLNEVFVHKRWRFLAPAAAAGLSIALTGTRSAVLAAFVGCTLFALLRVRVRNVVAYIIVGGALAVSTTFIDFRFALGLDDRFTDSLSYIHRAAVIASLPRLFARPESDLVLGEGPRSVVALFSNGVVEGVPGLEYFDNSFISHFAAFGLIGMVLLAAVILVALRGGALGAGLVGTSVVMFLSYDGLQWQISYMLLAMACALPRQATLPDGSRRGDERAHKSDPVGAHSSPASY